MSFATILSASGVVLPEWIGEILFSDDLVKGVGHRYIRRIATGNPRRPWRYYYSVTGGKGIGHDDEFTAGSKFKVAHNGQAGHFEIVGKTPSGDLRIKHDETGHESTVSAAVLRDMLHKEHATAIASHREKLAGDIKAANGSAARDKLKAEAAKYGHTSDLAKDAEPEPKAPGKDSKPEPKTPAQPPKDSDSAPHSFQDKQVVLRVPGGQLTYEVGAKVLGDFAHGLNGDTGASIMHVPSGRILHSNVPPSAAEGITRALQEHTDTFKNLKGDDPYTDAHKQAFAGALRGAGLKVSGDPPETPKEAPKTTKAAPRALTSEQHAAQSDKHRALAAEAVAAGHQDLAALHETAATSHYEASKAMSRGRSDADAWGKHAATASTKAMAADKDARDFLANRSATEAKAHTNAAELHKAAADAAFKAMRAERDAGGDGEKHRAAFMAHDTAQHRHQEAAAEHEKVAKSRPLSSSATVRASSAAREASKDAGDPVAAPAPREALKAAATAAQTTPAPKAPPTGTGHTLESVEKQIQAIKHAPGGEKHTKELLADLAHVKTLQGAEQQKSLDFLAGQTERHAKDEAAHETQPPAAGERQRGKLYAGDEVKTTVQFVRSTGQQRSNDEAVHKTGKIVAVLRDPSGHDMVRVQWPSGDIRTMAAGVLDLKNAASVRTDITKDGKTVGPMGETVDHSRPQPSPLDRPQRDAGGMTKVERAANDRAAAIKAQSAVDPALWKRTPAFGPAGGPDALALSAEGEAKAFSVATGHPAGLYGALSAVRAGGGRMPIETRAGARLSPLNEKHWPALQEANSKGLVARRAVDGITEYHLTPAGQDAMTQTATEQTRLLDRVKQAHGEAAQTYREALKAQAPTTSQVRRDIGREVSEPDPEFPSKGLVQAWDDPAEVGAARTKAAREAKAQKVTDAREALKAAAGAAQDAPVVVKPAEKGTEFKIPVAPSTPPPAPVKPEGRPATKQEHHDAAMYHAAKLREAQSKNNGLLAQLHSRAQMAHTDASSAKARPSHSKDAWAATKNVAETEAARGPEDYSNPPEAAGTPSTPQKAQEPTPAPPLPAQAQDVEGVDPEHLEGNGSGAHTVDFEDLPSKTQKEFNAGMRGAETRKVREWLHTDNKTLRSEFEARTGVKLPGTIKATNEAIEQWHAGGRPMRPTPQYAPSSVRLAQQLKTAKTVRVNGLTAGTPVFKSDPKALASGEAAKKLHTFTSTDKSRPNLHETVNVQDGKAYATDGHRLVSAPVKSGEAEGLHGSKTGAKLNSDLRFPDVSMVIPRRMAEDKSVIHAPALHAVASLLPKDAGRHVQASVLLHSKAGNVWATPLAHGEPTHPPVLVGKGHPNGGERIVQVNADYLRDSLKGHKGAANMSLPEPGFKTAHTWSGPVHVEHENGENHYVMPMRVERAPTHYSDPTKG